MNKTPKYVTPGLSPILKKYKTVKGANEIPQDEFLNFAKDSEVNPLRNIFSFDSAFKNTVLKSIIKNKNICIHPYNLTLLVSPFKEDNSMVQELNEAYLTYEYKDWYKKYYKKLDEEKLAYTQIITDINNFLKTTFIDCSTRFIVFPISIFYYRFIDDKLQFPNGHACFCIYDNFQEKGFFFDPFQNDMRNVPDELKYEELSYRKIIVHKVLNSIKSANPFLKIKSVEVVDITAPQFIADDYNCLFWSILLCDIITKNLKVDEEFKPKLAIQSLMKKYNTKEKLELVIRRYIGYIYEKAKSVPKSFYTNVLKNTYLEK